MKRTGRVPNFARAVLILGLLLALQGAVHGEVGVYYDLDQGPEPRGPYDISIIDDIDPVPTVWRRFSPLGSNRVALNPEGEANGDGRPSTLFNTVSKLPLVAWAKNSATGFDIVISVFTAGQWSTPVVLADSIHDELDPYLALDRADGSVHVVYWIDDAQPRVMHRQAPADLSSWTAPVQISQPGDLALRPSAVVFDGALLVAYESHVTSPGSTPRDIVVFGSAAGGVSHEVVAQTSFADENWPQIHAGLGKVWVDWIDEAGQMSWVRQPMPESPWDPPSIEIFESLEERDYHVRGAIRGQAMN